MQPKLIYDSLHGNIELSNIEILMLKSPFTNRLHQILQNSTAYLVFPSCKTSRFEHSVGVMDYSSELFLNGMKNSTLCNEYLSDKSDVLVDLIKQYNRDIVSDYYDSNIDEKVRHFIIPKFLKKNYNKGISDMSKLVLDSDECEILNQIAISTIGDVLVEKKLGIGNSILNPTHKFTYLILFQTVRMYGLLHDIGHLPFSHIFEFALDSARASFSESSISHPTAAKLNTIFNSQIAIHEEIGRHLVNSILKEVGYNFFNNNTLTEKEKIFKYFILKCIEITYKEISKSKSESKLSSLAAIIANPIDADRLDFVQRDGHVSGVSKSAGNVERIVKLFYLTRDDSRKFQDKYCFLPSIQSLHDVEKLLYDRLNIYKYMVNHHSVKRSDYILQKYIEYQLNKEIKENKVETSLTKVEDISDVISIINKILEDDNSFFEIKYSFTQLTDYWLLSFFSRNYFEKLSEQAGNSSSDYELMLLSEIYESKRSFKSLWKRIYNYKNFIISLGNEYLRAETAIDKIDFEHYKVDKYSDPEILFRLKDFNRLLNSRESDPEKIGKAIIHLLTFNNPGWCRKVERISNDKSGDKLVILVVKTNISNGLKEFSLVDNKDGQTIYSFDKMSSLPKTILEESDNEMKFFVYYNNVDNVIDANEAENVEIIIRESIIAIIKDLITNFANPKN